MRKQPDVHRIAAAVPNAVRIGGDDLKRIGARLEIRVKGHAPVAGFHPIVVIALQPIAEARFLRRNVGRGVEMKFQFAFARRHRDRFAAGHFPPIGFDEINMHLGRHLIGRDMRRINHDHAIGRGKPDAAVGSLAGDAFLRGFVGQLDGIHAVKHRALNPRRFAIGKVVHALAADGKDSPVRVHPEVPQIIGNDGVNVVVEQTVLPVNDTNPVVLEADNAPHCRPPHHAFVVFANPEHGCGHVLRRGPLLVSAIFNPENAAGGRHPNDAIPAGGQIEDPIHQRFFGVGKRVGLKIIRPRAIEFSADGHHDAVRIFRHAHHQVGVRVDRKKFLLR